MFDIALFAVASGMQFFIDSPMWLVVVRLLMGIAIGAEYAVGWPLMSEFSPTHLRGKADGRNADRLVRRLHDRVPDRPSAQVNTPT
jgi:MFS family permease